ncbi:MAG TPA: acyl-CoA synthetase, partial [Rhizobiales bacterium]|nr:acyl-CoA synthetase [Hyphomicrobiales bacterium]
MPISIYSTGLGKTPANFQPLTPLTSLARAAGIFPGQMAVIHGPRRFTYGQFFSRCRALASALSQNDIGRNDTVSVMLANTPAMLEAHHGIPMCGAVIHAMNTRLDAPVIAYMLDHAETKLLIIDLEFSKSIKQALELARVKPLVITCDDPVARYENHLPGHQDYEDFLATGDPDFDWKLPEDEWDAISLNYTSGTTGDPKGVVYHHRGAHLMGYANILAASMPRHPVYLWTLPMFHCNGWCFPWSLSVVAGTHVCLRQVRGKAIWDSLADHHVTHLCGAPIVMSTILDTPEAEKRQLSTTPEFFTAAAPPPESVLGAMARAGFGVTHLYGLTETYGPAVVNEWQEEWNALDPQQQARKKARQGVQYSALEGLSIRQPENMRPVPADGKTLGEVMFRGNIVMKGYLK